MRNSEGRVTEVVLDGAGEASAWISCPLAAVPAAGQYLLAWSPADPDAPLAAPLFPARFGSDGFLASSPVPRCWEPGALLELHGPLGRGFQVPAHARRLALAALGESVSRLLPLLDAVLADGGDVALFARCPLPPLPSSVEIHQLAALPEALPWADFLAVDLPLAGLPDLPAILGARHLPCLGQALVLAPMPCAGLAECGACAVPIRQKYKLACTDGPVFHLSDLLGS